MSITPSEVMLNTGYRDEGYGIITKGCIEAIKLVAETEGIFLDPVYTGKAVAELIDIVRKGQFTPKDTVVFIISEAYHVNRQRKWHSFRT